MTNQGLKVDALHKTFGQNHVVRGLELSLAPGEIVALLGPSGCGKTTALRMVAGLERPDSGEIQISDKTVFGASADLPPEHRNIGMVFQSYAVWPHRSVLQNVAYPLMLQKDPKANEKAERALELVQLPKMGDRPPSTLSGGQQQRVALARALVAAPALLLFDEPLSNLDAKLREEMRHEIRALAKKLGTTSLYVTHDQPEAFAVSDRVAVVLGGQIAQIAPPAQLYQEPSTLGIARFVGRLSELQKVERTGPSSVRLAGSIEVNTSFADAPENTEDWVLGVRPESVQLQTEPDDKSGLPGELLRATFLGEHCELLIQTECGLLRADVARPPSLSEGDSVRVKFVEGRAFARAS